MSIVYLLAETFHQLNIDVYVTVEKSLEPLFGKGMYIIYKEERVQLTNKNIEIFKAIMNGVSDIPIFNHYGVRNYTLIKKEIKM